MSIYIYIYIFFTQNKIINICARLFFQSWRFLTVEQPMSTLELRMDVPPIWQWYCLCERERETVREREGGRDAERECTFYIYYLENPSFKWKIKRSTYLAQAPCILIMDDLSSKYLIQRLLENP